ncbi:MAG: SH3 domain-containing protein [Thermomicrobiales bacterium]
MKFLRLSPLRLFAPPSPQLAPAGIGGNMMFARSTGGSGGGGDDDDYGFPDDEPAPPTSTRGTGGNRNRGRGGNGGRQRTVQFQPEERYWTEYLRIALPVIGLLLMLGLFWYWAQQLIGDDGNTTEPTATEQTLGSLDIITPTAPVATPEPTTAPAPTQKPATEVANTQGNQNQNQQGSTGDNQAGSNQTATEPPASEAATSQAIEIGAKVVTTDDVNLRPDASTEGEPVTLLKKGTELTVIDGPQTGENYTWWQVEDADGNQGWVASEFIKVAS